MKAPFVRSPQVERSRLCVNLERFENSGLISTVNGSVGDIFTMSGPGFEFDADDGSTLAVDAFLGKPGSKADNLVINGNVSGETELTVNNTNPRGGAYNKEGIPVVYVNGNVNSDSFFLPKPIDAGFVDYDLFFVPTGSGYFELRSLPGGGARITCLIWSRQCRMSFTSAPRRGSTAPRICACC